MRARAWRCPTVGRRRQSCLPLRRWPPYLRDPAGAGCTGMMLSHCCSFQHVCQFESPWAIPEGPCRCGVCWLDAFVLLLISTCVSVRFPMGCAAPALAHPLPYLTGLQCLILNRQCLTVIHCNPISRLHNPRGYALRRRMTRSVMEPTPVAHASLALDAYVQVRPAISGLCLTINLGAPPSIHKTALKKSTYR